MTGQPRSIFVTVGTTSFDELVQAVISDPVLVICASHNFNRIIVQFGRGAVDPTEPEIVERARAKFGVHLSGFRYQSSISDCISGADLVIGHGGAGTCLETLEKGTPLIVVLNEALQDAHQSELAIRLFEDGHLLYCKPAGIAKLLAENLKDWPFALKPLEPGNPKAFAAWLCDFVGVDATK